MTGGRHISQDDLTLYALQALSPEEAAEVRAHVRECEVCRELVAEINGELALVALSVEQEAVPEGARRRLMAKLAAGGAGSAPVAEARGRGEVVPIRPAGKAMLWTAWGAVAALLVLAVSLEVQVQRLSARLRQETAQTARLMEASAHAKEVLGVMMAPTAQRVVLTPARTKAMPIGRAIYLPARGGLIFQANNMAALPEDKTYELWVIPMNGAAPIPAGMFRPDWAGNASVMMPEIPWNVPAKAFGVTIEKAGGSATPTAPIIISGAAPAAGE
jgi:anti-sigma-K factor RskA